MLSIDQDFHQLLGAVFFSVFDLNAAYFQIPLSPSSRRVSVFYTTFGLFEFNRLPMGISVCSGSLTDVVDEVFADMNWTYVFN